MAIDEAREVWAKEMQDGTKAVGLFNRGELEANVVAKWADLGLKGKHSATCGGNRTWAVTRANSPPCHAMGW